MTRRAALLLVLIALVPAPAGAQTQQTQAPCPQLPANLHVANSYREWMVDLIARSPTLRRQCEAITSALHVQIYLESSRYLTGCCRARANFTRDGRSIHVVIEIPITADFPELLAHELEHVVEQIEGLNLREMARAPRSGVREVGTNIYETNRATTAGRTAARETRACLDAVQFGCGRAETLMVAAKD
jgi:hypothetical protein